MPISWEAYKRPVLVKGKTRYPMTENKEDRYNEINPRHEVKRYQGPEGREGGWKFAGYNPNHQTTSLERFNIRSDNYTLKPY